jgi:NAD(P)-dependent dehydrogenase (short-subunit alcohol dehydrogenase family)
MPVALIAGASRGLGLGLVAEYLGRGWGVVATARGSAPGLEAMVPDAGGKLVLEKLDVTDRPSIAALRTRLGGRHFDLVFVVAGVSGPWDTPIHAVSKDEAAAVFDSNALGPLAVAEAFADRIAPGGALAFMSSMLGSIARCESGGTEIYRASKAALNMLARCFSARHRDLAVICMAPGWVRTDMGGPNAPLDVKTSTRGMADTIAARSGTPGSVFVGYDGAELPW